LLLLLLLLLCRVRVGLLVLGRRLLVESSRRLSTGHSTHVMAREKDAHGAILQEGGNDGVKVNVNFHAIYRRARTQCGGCVGISYLHVLLVHLLLHGHLLCHLAHLLLRHLIHHPTRGPDAGADTSSAQNLLRYSLKVPRKKHGDTNDKKWTTFC
jgi:hypothetical protein